MNNVNVTNTRVSVTQVTNVYNTTIINNNTTNVTRITYANQHVANGVTAVSHDTFVNARPVSANIAKVDPKQLENAPVARSIAAQPVRQSVMGAGRPVTVRPPAATMNRQVVATRQPPPPRASLGQRPVAEPNNVRTEAPGQAQTAARAPAEPARPAQPAARPSEAQASQPARPPAPPAAANNRPAAPPNIPRPAMGGGGHPLVRQAPPVQENPQHQQNEQTKFNAWQQQRQAAPPRPPQPRAAQPAHEEKPHK